MVIKEAILKFPNVWEVTESKVSYPKGSIHEHPSSLYYTSRHVPGLGVGISPLHIPYLPAYPSGLSPALSSRRKNTGVNLK